MGKQTFPIEWNPSKVDEKTGWKNRSTILAEIATFVNNEIYLEDESEFMEKADIVLEYLKTKYKIQPLKTNNK